MFSLILNLWIGKKFTDTLYHTIGLTHPLLQDLKDMSGKDDNLSQAELAALKKEWLAEMKAQMKVNNNCCLWVLDVFSDGEYNYYIIHFVW